MHVHNHDDQRAVSVHKHVHKEVYWYEEKGHASEHRFGIQIVIEGQSTCGESTLYDQVYRLFRETFIEGAWHRRCIEIEPFNRVTCLKPANTKMIPTQVPYPPIRLMA